MAEQAPKVNKLYSDGGSANRTDLIVRHDTKYSRQPIVKPYTPIVQADGNDAAHTQVQDNTRVDGIYAPLVKLNNRVLDMADIVYFSMRSTSFMPQLTLIVQDRNGMIEFSDVPGLDNEITVILTPAVEGAYSAIGMKFYVTDCSFTSGIVTYEAVFKHIPLEETQLKQVKFHHPSNGCQAKKCKLGPNDKPTTYEFLHVIAEETGLGFAATQQTKEIADTRYRLMSSETYRQAIQKHMRFSGLDEDSMLDCWIDFYAYIDLVNVSWVMNEKIDVNDLAIKAVVGIDSTEENVMMQQKTDYVQRTLTNYKAMPTFTDLVFYEWEAVTDPGTNMHSGTFNHYNMMTALGACGTEGANNCSTYDVKQQELSQAGVKFNDDYMFHKTSFIGMEMANENPILKQTTLRDKYFEKIRSRMLKITMARPNYGLMRGCVVNVDMFEYGPAQKQKIISQLQGVYGDQESDGFDEEQKRLISVALSNDNIGVLNPALSGQYYIDGMEFVYEQSEQKVKQVLWLIKKGNIVDWDNRATRVKVAPPRE